MMYSKTRLTRSSNSDSNLHSEMKTWRKNKMEDRKLALQNEEVDKNKAATRKNYQQEQISFTKDFSEKFSKKTPSADEYLEKSQAKYTVWKERERERLDRRYRNLHRSYFEEYKKLGIENYGALKQRKKSKSDNAEEAPSEEADTEKDIEALDNETMSEEDALQALEKLNLDMTRRRFSDVCLGNKHPNSRRRGSTGSIDLAEFAKLRSLHLALTTVTEDKPDQEESEEGEEETEADDKLENLNDITTRRRSSIMTDEPIEDITVEDLIVRQKRRASIATTPKQVPAGRISIPLGKRFDRRPTLPNIAIPFKYGN